MTQGTPNGFSCLTFHYFKARRHFARSECRNANRTDDDEEGGYEGMKQREKTTPQALPRLIEALERLVQLYEATGNAAEAERYRKELASRKAAQKEPKK